MDFSPQDILVREALGKKNVPSDIKSSEPDQVIVAGQRETSDSEDNDRLHQEMGKTTSINLKHRRCVSEAEIAMTPQKVWDSDSLVQGHFGKKLEHFSFDELMQRFQNKGLDVELQKIIDTSDWKDLYVKEEVPDPATSPVKHAHGNIAELRRKGLCQGDSVKGQMDNLSEVGFLNSGCVTTDKNVEESFGGNEHKGMQQCGTASNHFVGTEDKGDSKMPSEQKLFLIPAHETIVLDHPYACVSNQMQLLTSEDEGDICSSCSFSGDTKHCRCHQIIDNKCPKFGAKKQLSTCTQEGMLNAGYRLQTSSTALQPSVDRTSRHLVVSGDNGHPLCTGMVSSASVNFPARSATENGSSKIDSLPSFNTSNLELAKFLKCRNHASKKPGSMIHVDSQGHYPALSSPAAQPDVYALLHSPTLDWDRSEAGSEAHDDSSDARTPGRTSPYFFGSESELLHSVFHDHDYCVRDRDTVAVVDDLAKLVTGKRKSTKRKNSLDKVSREKIMKAKYLKEELLRPNSPVRSRSDHEPVLSSPALVAANAVGRPRKRYCSKNADGDIDPETGTKLKITGKFKDQYVYYLSKSSRTTTRRREAPAPSSALDRIIVPAPNPGDIIVPHLTDADIENVRMKGRDALSNPEAPHLIRSLSTESAVMYSGHSNDPISDVDSHIVSTILSMENDSLTSQSAMQTSDSSSTGSQQYIPNQQAMAESLRLMSGDSGVTSEHVLNYLLSMMKDDGLLGSGPGCDSSWSGWFPSLHPDGNSTKIGDTEGSDDLSTLDTTTGQDSNSGQDLLSISEPVHNSPHGSQAMPNTITNCKPDQIIHAQYTNADLPDDLSSFMPTSKRSPSSDGDSNSSMKSIFESDLSSLGTPQMPSSVIDLTSREKTLDYLGVRDEDIKVDSSFFDTKLDHISDSTQALTPLSSISSDDTPWIVTVTLYFNDLPAIMIINEPYIRLVDIHKQILPAKDTGILKKRCQLLSIPVLTCSDMQRYFLVQYGRAYNSKSSLIISKDHATDLVAYYANPQPRLGKTEERTAYRTNRGRPPAGARSHGAHNGSKKLEGRSLRKSRSSGVLYSDALEKSLTLKNSVPRHQVAAAPRSQQTRHKRVNYLDMLKGEKDKQLDGVVSEAIDSVVKSVLPCINEGKSNKRLRKKKSKNGFVCGDKNSIAGRKLSSVCQDKNGEGRWKMFQKFAGSKAVKMVHRNKEIEERDMGSLDDSDDSIVLKANKKCKPLKLKMNSLLNFALQRKGCSTVNKKSPFSHGSCTSSEKSQRILAVAHEAALSGSSAKSHLPSQPADIHLDIFFNSDSACVCCRTCGQFLSVPNFMQHHHIPIKNDWQISEAAQRILVPLNKDSLSPQEKQLWVEFHQRQEAIGGFGEADNEIDSNEDEGCHKLLLEQAHDGDVDHSPEELVGALPPSLSVDTSSLCTRAHEKGLVESRFSAACCYSTPVIEDIGGRASFESHDLVSICDIPSYQKRKPAVEHHRRSGLEWQNTESLAEGLARKDAHHSISNPRTSSRKRKSKQLFSIENYHMPSKWVIGEGPGSRKPVRT